MEDRIKEKLEEVSALYDQGKDDKLSSFARGILTGVNQTLLWVLEPDNWAEPLSTIPGLDQV